MKAKLVKYFFSTFLISILVAIFYFQNPNYSMKSDSYRGTVVRKFKNKENRNYETLEIQTISLEKKYTSGHGHCYSLYRDASIGDSIIKIQGSIKLILKKKDSVINTYIFADGSTDNFCYGYRKLREGE